MGNESVCNYRCIQEDLVNRGKGPDQTAEETILKYKSMKGYLKGIITLGFVIRRKYRKIENFFYHK